MTVLTATALAATAVSRPLNLDGSDSHGLDNNYGGNEPPTKPGSN